MSTQRSKFGIGFIVTARGSSYVIVNGTQIASDIAGKNINDAKLYLEKLAAGKIIKTANVKLSLLWMRSLPADKAKIRIDMTY